MKKRLWIITELFYPDEVSTSYILTHIAKYLSSDFEVGVICGPNETGNQGEPLEEDIRVIRHNVFAWSKNNIILRLFRLIGLSIVLFVSAIKHIRTNDKVLIVTNPAPMLLLFSMVNMFRKCELTILVHDVFPENTIAAGLVKSPNSILYKLLKVLFDKAYAKADKLIVLGRDMRNVIKEKIKGNHTRIYIIENWADIDVVYPTPKDDSLYDFNCEGKILIQYAGNVGRVQGLEKFIQCLHHSQNPGIHMVIWGDGAVLPKLKQYVESNHIPNVSFMGTYRRSEQNKIISSCDLSLISLSDNMYGLGVPSKSYNIMAAGSPILFIGDATSEIALTVKENELGYVVNNNEADIIEFLRNLHPDQIPQMQQFAKNARYVAETKFSRVHILEKYKNLFLD